jgi:hypothetical protein
MVDQLVEQPSAMVAQPPTQKPPVKLGFKSIIKPFKPTVAACELVSPSHRYPGRRDVLLTGVAAYAVEPSLIFAITAMRLKASEIYARQCELIALNADQPSPDAAPAPACVWSPSQLRYFKKWVYDPLNVRNAMTRTISRTEFKSRLHESADRLAQAHRIIEIWHFLVQKNLAGAGTDRLLGIRLGSELASAVGYLDGDDVVRHPSARTFERSWEELSVSASLSYAAAGVHLPKRGTILDLILDGILTRKAVSGHLEQWFGRAKFVHETILGGLYPGKSTDRFIDLSVVPIAARPFPAPHFGNRDAAQLRAAYS